MITAGASGRPGGEEIKFPVWHIISADLQIVSSVRIFVYNGEKFDGKNRKMTISFIDKRGSVWYNIFIMHIQKMC